MIGTSQYPITPFGGSERGGVRIRAIIVFITLVMVGAAIFLLLDNYGRNQQVDHRKALAISEYGLMEVLQTVQTSPSTVASVPKTDYDVGWYKVTINRYAKNDTVFLAIRSDGHAGGATERRECTLRRNIVGRDTVWTRESMH